MKNVFTYIYIGLAFIFLFACSTKEEPHPEKAITTYIDAWEEYRFDDMYSMLSTTSKDEYKKEDFIDRYEKVYTDLKIDDLSITYDLTDEEEVYSVEVEMDSIAGHIHFTYDLSVELEEKEEDEDEWKIIWNPGLIFPELADGGKLRIDREKPKRGEILDRNQMPLAINDVAYEVGVVPNQFENIDEEISRISQLLDLSVKSIENKLNASWVEEDHFVPLKTIPQTDQTTLNELKNLPGVSTRNSEGRMYPSEYATAHLIGYIGLITNEEMEAAPKGQYREDDFIGKRGLERQFEEQLRGIEGVKIFVEKEDENGQIETKTIAERQVKHGERIQLTIDINLQELLYEQYESKYSGTAIALDPKTGEVLAMVSSPSFSPIEFTYGISQARWDALMEDKSEPFVNRATATFAPGSVIKPITSAIGLNSKHITHEEGIEIEGLTWKKNNWKDFHISRVSTSSKPVDLEDALVRSDNIYFAMKAIDMGNETFTKGLKSFGFDENIPIELSIKKSQISNDGSLKDEVQRANTGYGQGEIEVSSLHLALMYSAFLNNGNIAKPTILYDQLSDENWKEELIKKDDLEKIQTYLRKVVSDGTAQDINDEDFPISGKTGTSELKSTQESSGQENGWFVGYPAEEQDLVVAMMIEQVEDLGGSLFVAEKVGKVLKEYKK